MIFRRRKNSTDDKSAVEETAGAPEAAESTAEAGDAAESGETTTATASRDDDWARFDVSADWREDGPFDLAEVDLEADDIQRLDFGSLIVTPPQGAEIRLQVAEGTESIVSLLVVLGESALELAAFSAPRTPGLWAEIREQVMEQTAAAKGTCDCVEGPFGTELVRNQPVQLPDGRVGLQATRMWMAEGPRWVLRGVLMGKAAMTVGVDNDVVGPLFDTFSDVVVRRGDEPRPVGDLLRLQLPEQATAHRVPTD